MFPNLKIQSVLKVITSTAIGSTKRYIATQHRDMQDVPYSI